ncbi:MAG: hypothetical protein KGI04_01415 [Candidatus Micrarchaeota archaeon]|nr:hypothetical protein [Candidatus Micrarchaeota archaeon]
MKELSFLIFSKGNANLTLGLIRDVYPLADEIVLVDSSDAAQSRVLEAGKRRFGFGKLKMFHVVALGYPDPLRMYALKKCSGRWVFLLDTDERLSDGLKATVRSAIRGAEANAFRIARYETVEGGRTRRIFTWQTRLFRNGAVTFRGMIHEQPEVRGNKIASIDKSSYLIHLQSAEKLKHGDEYNKMEIFASAAKYKARTLFSILPLIKAYGVSGARELNRTHEQNLKRWMAEEDRGTIAGIAREIKKVGVTRFLNLEDEKVVSRINRKYGNGKIQGINLLIRLLKERYEATRSRG